MHSDFIEVYDDALDAQTCAALIRRFDASGKAVRGQTGSGVDTSLKDSWDICISEHAEWNDAVVRFNQSVMTGLKRYLRRYAYAVLAPLQLRQPPVHALSQQTLSTQKLDAHSAALPQASLSFARTGSGVPFGTSRPRTTS